MSNKIKNTVEENSSESQADDSIEETPVPEAVPSEIGRKSVRNFDITGKDPIIKNN